MTTEYSVEITKRIEDQFHHAALHRPMRVDCYDVGTELDYDVTEVAGANRGQVHLIIEKFVGGGFAGQVYQVKVLADGFEHEGEEYKSLTGVAKAITGTHTNGYLFFRLGKYGGAK